MGEERGDRTEKNQARFVESVVPNTINPLPSDHLAFLYLLFSIPTCYAEIY